MINTINPFTREKIHSYNLLKLNQVEKIINQSNSAFNKWSHISLNERINLIKNLKQVLDSYKKNISELITLEMGKPISQSVAEVKKCIDLCGFYIENIEQILNPKKIKLTNTKDVYTHYCPLGSIIGIMPWNFPLWQVLRFAIPTLLVGNTVLLKHSPNVTGMALMIEKLFKESGCDEYIFQTLIVDLDLTKKILLDGRISGVSLTGSTKAGKSVAETAGKTLKKCLFELGGSDPYIVFADADLKKTAKICVQSRMTNSGQSCVAAKRFIVNSKIKDDFLDCVLTEMKMYKPSDPLKFETNLGPLARFDLKLSLIAQIDATVKAGAKCILGTVANSSDDYFVSPTILVDIPKESPAAQEELFGPVVSIFTFNSENEAINMANSHQYALGAAVFTQDISKAELIAKHHLTAGVIAINDMVQSNPRYPFGGLKYSGYGRELGFEGVYEFCNLKTII